MQEPITLKELEDLKRRLLELRCSGKLLALEDIETINDAILAVQTLKVLSDHNPFKTILL